MFLHNTSNFHLLYSLFAFYEVSSFWGPLYRIEDQRFYQCTPEDALIKCKLFPQRFPYYFSKADNLYLMWSDDLYEPERLAAILERGQVFIKDSEAYERFKHKYEKDRNQLQKEGKELPDWESLLKSRKEA